MITNINIEPRRNTVQRRVILEAMKELNIHATAEQVFDHIHKKHPSISRATVYRNLGQMAESGELINIGSFFGSAHYDHNRRKHYHFICEKCRQIFDVNNYFHDIFGKISGMDGFEFRSHNLTFSGLCRDCKDQQI